MKVCSAGLLSEQCLAHYPVAHVMRLAGTGAQLQQLGDKASSAVQKAATNVKEAFDEIDDNILEYCSLDAKVLCPFCLNRQGFTGLFFVTQPAF